MDGVHPVDRGRDTAADDGGAKLRRDNQRNNTAIGSGDIPPGRRRSPRRILVR